MKGKASAIILHIHYLHFLLSVCFEIAILYTTPEQGNQITVLGNVFPNTVCNMFMLCVMASAASRLCVSCHCSV